MKLILLTRSEDLSAVKGKLVGLLVQCAPDNTLLNPLNSYLSIEQLIGNQEQARFEACMLANTLLINEPFIRGLSQLSVLKEMVIAEINKVILFYRLFRFLTKEGFSECEFLSPCWWSEGLLNCVELLSSSLIVKVRNKKSTSEKQQILHRIKLSKFNYANISEEVQAVIRRIDPYHRLSLLNKKPINYKKNKNWFYTTAVNYSKIALMYEPYFSEPFEYLFENKLTGGKFLKNTQAINLYRFNDKNFIPKKFEIKFAIERIQSYLEATHTTAHDDILKRLFLKSRWLLHFYNRLLGLGLTFTSIFRKWIDLVNPANLIVGNTVFENYALLQAKKHHITTILLQHGTVTDYDRYVDHSIDHYIMRGKFWLERLSDPSKRRASVLNCRAHSISAQVENDRIILITTPVHLGYININVDFDCQLNLICQTLSNKPVKLVVRVHPLEKISDYEQRINKIIQEQSLKLIVEFSQFSSLDSLLNGALAAIMLSSTVILDCIRLSVPVISIGWFNFSFGEVLRKKEICYFAENLNELELLIKKALKKGLVFNKNNQEYFFANTTEKNLKAELNLLCR